MKAQTILLLVLSVIALTNPLLAKEIFTKEQLAEHLDFDAERINRFHVTSLGAEIWHAESDIALSMTALVLVARYKDKKTEKELEQIRQLQSESTDEMKKRWKEFSSDVDPRATLYFATFLGGDTPGNGGGFFYVLNGKVIKQDLSGRLG